MSGMSPERLAEIEARAGRATEGPWAPWLDQDDQPHMEGLLMVGNAAAVIPEGQSWVEGVDVNPIAHTYTPEDRHFIAHVRTDVPALLAEVKRLWDGINGGHGPVQEFEPCQTEWKGCDDPACTEGAHNGGFYHCDQPTGHVCLTCRDEDGAPMDWPCPTAALLNPEP